MKLLLYLTVNYKVKKNSDITNKITTYGNC